MMPWTEEGRLASAPDPRSTAWRGGTALGRDTRTAVRQGVGGARGPPVRGGPRAPVRRPPPGPRGDVRRRPFEGCGRPGAGCAARAHRGDRRPNVPTGDRSLPLDDPIAAKTARCAGSNSRAFGVELFDLASPQQGIVHVSAPSWGLTQRGWSWSAAISAYVDPTTRAPSARSALPGSARARSNTCWRPNASSCPSRPRWRRGSPGRLSPGVTAQGPDPGARSPIGTAGRAGSARVHRGGDPPRSPMEEPA